MSSKFFNALVVATIVLVVASLLIASRDRQVVIDFVRGQQLVTTIDVDRVTDIEITKGKSKVMLQNRNGSFLVTSRDSYPADVGKVNNLVHQCLDITCAREIGSSAEALKDLGLDGTGDDSTVVRFLNGGQELVGVVVGKSEGSGNYVRVKSSNTAYMSEKSVFLDTDALSFVDKTLTSLENVRKVEVAGDGQPYVIAKKGEDITLEGIPEGKTTKASEHTSTFNAGSNLTFADFQSEASAKEIEFKHTYVATTDAGERYTFQLGKKGEDWYCKVSAKYTGPRLTFADVQKSKDKPEEMKKQEAYLKAQGNVQSFNDRHQSWVYKLSKWNGDQMTKKFDDLVEEDKAFLKIDEKSIASVTVTKTTDKGPESYTLQSPSVGVVKLGEVPKDKKEKPFVPHSVFTAPVTLAWSQRVKPDDKSLEKTLQKAKFDTTYVLDLQDKQRYTFVIAHDEGRYFTKASAEFTGDDKSTESAAVIAKGAVAKFNERHKGHVYEVTGGIANMVMPKSDLLMDAAARPEEIEAAHILISYKGAERSSATRTKEEAKALADKLLEQVRKSPQDFGKLAKENSDDPSKGEDGKLPRFKFDAMVKPFSEAAFKLDVGAISEVVETKFGFHIIKRTQ